MQLISPFKLYQLNIIERFDLIYQEMWKADALGWQKLYYAQRRIDSKRYKGHRVGSKIYTFARDLKRGIETAINVIYFINNV